MKILISIPVHEKPDVINDLIVNIKKYVKNSVIVLHISKGFYDNYKEEDILQDANVLINPEHLQTSWGNIYQTHISNFIYADQIVDFDYILLQASNDMFIIGGIEEYIKKFDAGFNRRVIWQDGSLWWPAACAFNDNALKKVMNYIGITRIVASQVEGSFYKREIFRYISKVLTSIITKDDEKNFNFYSREEVYFSTIASKIVDYSKCGLPTTFSEVHRFDRWMFTIRKKIYKLNNLVLHYFLPTILIDKAINHINKILFNSKLYKIKKMDIDSIKFKRFKNPIYLNDWPGYFVLYNNNLFSAKRIPREYNDCIRKYIREIK